MVDDSTYITPGSFGAACQVCVRACVLLWMDVSMLQQSLAQCPALQAP